MDLGPYTELLDLGAKAAASLMRVVNILPRLGSRVRIPSAAPTFFKKIQSLEGCCRVVFSFPPLASMPGKPGEAGRGER
jgi:hypothetical protein